MIGQRLTNKRKNRKQAADAETTTLPAEPYEPTAQESAVVRKIIKRLRSEPRVPRMKVTTSQRNGEKVVRTAVDHPDLETGYAILSATIAVCDQDFLLGQLKALGNVANKQGAFEKELLDYGISIVAGIQPKDYVEALLATQMAAVQVATMDMAARLGNASNRENRAAAEKGFSRLARTFVAQVEALKRHRSKGEQRVYVERVNVEQGGQAIVGPVTHGGRGGGDDSENDR
jgi:hypothetical protein